MNGIQATRLALLTALLLTGATAEARAQAGSREHQVRIEREQLRKIEELQRALERATREFSETQAAFAQAASPAQRDALVQARGQLETARANLNRELLQLMMTDGEVRRGDRLAPSRVTVRTMGADTVMFFQPVQPRGWLGVSFSTRWEEVSDGRGRSVWRFGAYPVIETVEPGSPADRAGLVAGDVLVTIGGRDVVRGATPFSELLRPGAVLPIQVRRGAELRSVSARIVARPQGFTMVTTNAAVDGAPGTVRIVQHSGPHSNVAVSTSTTDRRAATVERVTVVPVPVAGASALGVVAGAELFPIGARFQQALGLGEGLLVLRVAPGTPSARAGIRTGDVIVGVNGTLAATPEALRALLEAESSRSATVQLVRDGGRVTVPLRW